MTPLRPIPGYKSLNIDGIQRIDLSTSCSIHEELFAALRFYSEVQDVGLEFVKKMSKKTDESEIRKIFALFQGFIRQGETFFSSAQSLHHRASPLFFYYSFLNLAKAYICLQKPELFERKLKHGLIQKYSEEDFQKQAVTTSDERGVFQVLYEQFYSVRLPKNCSFNVMEILGYVTDVAAEYNKANYGEPKNIPGKIRVAATIPKEGKVELWPILALANFERLENKRGSLGNFYRMFEEVDFDKNGATNVFGISPEIKAGFRFFQSKRTYLLEVGKPNEYALLIADSQSALKAFYAVNPFKTDFDFNLSIPLGEKSEIPFNEFFAGYAIFYFLGSLVRYHPHYLEKIFLSKEAWIIERFTKSSATTLLRHMSYMILGEIQVLFPR